MLNSELDKIFEKGLSKDRHFEIPESFINDMKIRIKQRRRIKLKKNIIISSVSIIVICTLSILAFGNKRLTPDLSTSNTQTHLVAKSDDISLENNSIKLTNKHHNNRVVKDSYPTQTNTINPTIDISKTRSTTKKSIGQLNTMPPPETTLTTLGNKTQEKSLKVEGYHTKIKESSPIVLNTLNNSFETSALNLESLNPNSTPTFNSTTELLADLKQIDKTTLNIRESNTIELSTSEIAAIKTGLPIELFDIVQYQNDTITNGESIQSYKADTIINENDENINLSIDKKNKPTFELSVYGGTSFTKGKLTVLDKTISSNFNLDQKQAISDHFGIHSSLNINAFSFGVGIESHKYIDKINFNTVSHFTTSFDSIKKVIKDSVIVDNQGDTVTIFTYTGYDTTTYTVDDSTVLNRNTTNTYKTLSIPIYFGYSFSFNSWLIRPQIGGIIEFTRQSFSGIYPYNNGTPTATNLQSIKLGYALNLNCQVRKYVSNYYVYIQPGYRVKLSNTAESSQANIKHRSIDVLFGAGYRF